MAEIEIIYRDSHFIAVNKPPGLLVHRTRISRDSRFLLQLLRDQLGQWVYPVHRLDRPTSGLILFALDPQAARLLVAEFEARRISKHYLAIVRGYTDETGRVDYPLVEEAGRAGQPAVTDYRSLARVELPIPVGRYQTARYTLIEARPLTGRMHQIRKHMKHIFHPVVGDTTHGDGKQNRLFRERMQVSRLLLMASKLAFKHPYSGRQISLSLPLDQEWQGLFARFGWSDPELYGVEIQQRD